MSHSHRSAVAGVVVGLAAIILALIWFSSRLRSKPSIDNSSNPVEHPYVLRSTQDYQRGNQIAAGLLSDVFPKVASGLPLNPKDEANLRQAVRIYDGMLAYQPTNPAPNFTCGQALAALGYHDDAIARFQQFLLAIGPDPAKPDVKVMGADAHSLIGESLEAKHDYKGAVEQLDTALKIYPRIPNYLVLRASAEIQLSEPDKAQADLEAAIKYSDPTDPALPKAQAMEKLLTSKR